VIFKVLFTFLVFVITSFAIKQQFLLPILSANRELTHTLQLTDIGHFGLLRAARETVPAHYHTGIDIIRSKEGYGYEPIYPISEGVVISIRDDGPFAQVIIFHESDNRQCWSVYEHIAGIQVNLHDHVNPYQPLARFMNKEELDKYGWQFNHFHLEIMKHPPVRIDKDVSNPDRKYTTYSITCYTTEDLEKYYHDPIEFFKDNLGYK